MRIPNQNQNQRARLDKKTTDKTETKGEIKMRRKNQGWLRKEKER